jgi:hypothetical protein
MEELVEGGDALGLIAEISIAVAGFAGVVATLRAPGIIVLQLANALCFRQLWPFFLGLLALTAHSLLLFAYILFAPSRAEVQA